METLPTRSWAAPTSYPTCAIYTGRANHSRHYVQHIVARLPSSRSRLPSLLHPVFRRAPVEGTVGLRNPVSCDPVRERGDQVFGECTRATTGIEFVPNDDFFPNIANLFIDDMGDASGSAAAASYMLFIFLFQILLEFLLVVVALDSIYLSTVLVDHMIGLILVILVINCLLFSWIKSLVKLLIYSTVCTCLLTTFLYI